ncbi:hypothetical protein SCLCIDRAFT_23132 [Scleroderma citrinum Foug A]|uniref:CxC2-like cysteine cluster KDZ transposase-associated domain-containing protein n=1 Tax=Scleroderma citrinum Foug A TaxID=1036808 RepID=A0A0C3AJF8_9AGAM|nr:hypothetical protein SCLCIDRAFT_23132 [Scleroderma citrinum Foug A]
MHSAWDAQLPSLVDAYLLWKHRLATAPEESQARVEHDFHVTLVGMFDSDPRFAVPQWHDELANVSLICNGLLGCTPTSPELTITFQCLELYHQLRRRQSSFGIQAYTKVLCVLHGVTYRPHFRNQFSMAFNVYLTILRAIQCHINQALRRDNPNWRLQHYCPACTFKQPGEPILVPSSLKAMDGNNSAKRMDHAGHADRRTGSKMMCACEQAASVVDEDTVKVFKQTGIFLSACRHGIILTCAEMLHSGELAKYPLATINKLISMHAACSIAQMARAANMQLVVNTFHGHAHNCMCQLQYHPLYLPGTGLEDFETCGHVFSSSNATVALIRHASHYHYVQYLELHFSQWDADKYAELINLTPNRFLLNNYKQAVRLISTNMAELDAYCALHPHENLDFGSWVAEELAYLKAVESEPKQDMLRVTYVDELEKLAKLQYKNALQSSQDDNFLSYNQLSFTPGSAERQVRSQQDRVEDLEEQLGIEPTDRWTPEMHKYVEMCKYSQHRQFIHTVEELENLVVQCLFELSKANLASTGYKLPVQHALERYNKLAMKQSPLRPVLQYSEVLSYATLGDFDLLKHSQHDVLARLWSNTMHCHMAVKYFKLLRAHEEINWLNVEVRQLQAWIDNETAEIKQIAAELSAQSPLLSAKLWALFYREQRINIQHQLWLQCIYDLEGYSGVRPVIEHERGGEDKDKEAEEDEAQRLDACINVMSC